MTLSVSGSVASVVGLDPDFGTEPVWFVVKRGTPTLGKKEFGIFQDVVDCILKKEVTRRRNSRPWNQRIRRAGKEFLVESLRFGRL